MDYLAMAWDAEAAAWNELPVGVSHLLVADDALAQGTGPGPTSPSAARW